jgi:hypothetical protein
MKKKTFLILVILALSLISADKLPNGLKRLTVVNKSGRELEISLNGKTFNQFYYLNVPEGSRDVPVERYYTVVPDTYSASVYYYELWDPVYGNQCGTKGDTLDLRRNVKITIFECDTTPPNHGEPPANIKFAGSRGKKGR